MHSQVTTVINVSGLHARPAGLFVAEAKKYASDITIRNISTDSVKKNAKSIISILGLAMVTGSEVEISAQGDDSQQAVTDLIAFIDSGCGE